MHVPIFDADNHLYETEEALTKFLPARYKGIVKYVELDGRKKIVLRDRLSDFIPNPTFEYVAAPGSWEQYFRVGNPEGKSQQELFGRPIRSIPAFREPKARLDLMDEQLIERSLMFPTLASLVEERLRDDVEATHAVVHALNEWLYETWQFDYEHRIFTTPVVTLPIVEKAIEELEWVVERGARVVLIRPAPVPGFTGSRSFALPEFDPFWAKVVEHDVLVALHSSDSGQDRYTNEWLGRDTEYLPFRGDAFRSLHLWRPVEDCVGSLACHGALSRFPELKIAIVENGSGWLGPLFTSLQSLYKKMPQHFQENPVDAIRRNIHISPFWEEDLVALAGLLGEDRVLFGSDFPHPEGLAEPRSYLAEMEGVPDELVRKIMGGNLARLMNVPADLARGYCMTEQPPPAAAGVYLPQIRMDFATIEARARTAEEVGFHSVWFIDHVAPPAARELDLLDAWTVATAVAMRTERLHIGHLVLCAPFHHPVVLAKMAASLDVVSGGRLELGLGWGSVASELVDYGVTTEGPKMRAERLAETLEILGRLWTGEPVDFDGVHWTLRNAICRPRPTTGRVPIHIGGSGPQLTMPLVERYADWWNCPSSAIDRLDDLRPRAGDVRVSMQHPIGLAASSAERDEVVDVTQRRFGGWGGVVAGTPDEVAAVLQAERRAGAELFICQFHDFGRPESLRLFADEVLPALS